MIDREHGNADLIRVSLGLYQLSMRMYAHQYPKAQQQSNHGSATIADKRQGHADHGQNAADHAHVDKGVGKKCQRDAARH